MPELSFKAELRDTQGRPVRGDAPPDARLFVDVTVTDQSSSVARRGMLIVDYPTASNFIVTAPVPIPLVMLLGCCRCAREWLRKYHGHDEPTPANVMDQETLVSMVEACVRNDADTTAILGAVRPFITIDALNERLDKAALELQ